MQTSAMRDVAGATFEADVLGAAGPVLVEFSADWCPPCRMMEPVLADLATVLAGRLEIRRLDTDRDQDLTIRYGVLGMPTLILFSGGEPVDRLVGFSSAARVRRWVGDALLAAGPDAAG